ncbi:MAG: exodeoxyribonuclease VII large subunit [Candidatus Acetothermia bacterium]
MKNSEPDLFSPENGPEEEEVFSVSRLNREARLLLEGKFSSIWVEGEVSNLHVSSAGHRYFTLKEEDSEIDAVMFAGDASGTGVELEDGKAILVKATLTVYERRGRYQLRVRDLKEVGEGELQKKFRRLKKRLKQEGLFEDSHKKRLPDFPESVGIITSPTGAAIRDIVSTIEGRYSLLDGYIFPVKVQGKEAAGGIARAVERANRLAERLGLDVLILSRGGGSLEDLWPFNEEVVARAIYSSELPVISGVGHEVDFTISDFVADSRVPTPTAAGKEVVPEGAEVVKEGESLVERIGKLIRSKIRDRGNELDRTTSSFGFRLPFHKLEDGLQEYDDLSRTLMTSGEEVLADKADRLENLIERLSLANPTRLLKKGYSVTYSEGGSVINDASGVDTEESLKTVLHKGIIRSVVTEVEEDG